MYMSCKLFLLLYCLISRINPDSFPRCTTMDRISLFLILRWLWQAGRVLGTWILAARSLKQHALSTISCASLADLLRRL